MTPRRPVPSERWRDVASTIANSATENFAELFRVSGLDPKRHLKFADWSGVSFRDADLRGFDFTGARLLGCDFSSALIKRARFDQAEIHSVQRDLKKLPFTDLRAAADWPAYSQQWKKSERVPPDDHLPIGAIFQDAPFAPEMVVIPPGHMKIKVSGDHPLVPLTITAPFAVGRFPVTLQQWQAAFNTSGVQQQAFELYGHMPDRPSGNGAGPVTHVSWEDAKQYTAWLAKMTGKPYRLLSETEHLYCEQEDGVSRVRGDPNSFGFYDHRVHEWCEDIWSDDVEHFPSDGFPRVQSGDPNLRLIRVGGVFYFEELFEHGVDNDYRASHAASERNDRCGFRVARNLID